MHEWGFDSNTVSRRGYVKLEYGWKYPIGVAGHEDPSSLTRLVVIFYTNSYSFSGVLTSQIITEVLKVKDSW